MTPPTVSRLCLIAVSLLACTVSFAAPTLKYDQRTRVISLESNGSTTTIERISKNMGPELVGMAGFVRILPPELQPYKDSGILLFNTVRRSTAGDGRGQCGGGYEMYLHAVDMSQHPPKKLGKTLVGSCLKDLYPSPEGGPTDFSAYSVENGRLRLHFLDRSATLSTSFTELEFEVEAE